MPEPRVLLACSRQTNGTCVALSVDDEHTTITKTGSGIAYKQMENRMARFSFSHR